ncbi:MAG: hypothetical protein FWC47_15595, partial [Oscillospiraceae bacterium]|nr:hypothetical protein [Oscillospiraceae bacterium]
MKGICFIKRVFSLLIITTLLFTLCACKKDTGNWDSGSIYTYDVYNSDGVPSNIMLYNSGCSYDLAGDGTLTFSYKNGKSATFPVKIPKLYTEQRNFYFVYISVHKTSVAYFDEHNKLKITYSEDMGKTWVDAQSISPQQLTEDFPAKVNINLFSLAWMGFTSEYDGWIIFGSEVRLGSQWHALYTTKDGGKTWE